MQIFFYNQHHPFDEADFKGLVNRLAAIAANRDGKSLLYLAVEAGKNEQVIVQLMDICIEYELVPKGKSPLLPALIERNKDMLATILRKRSNWIHLKNEEGRVPLHDAASTGFLEGVSYLIEKCKSCIIERDSNGCFPVHLACIGGHFKIVQQLLKHFPHVNEIVDNNGRNLLHVAAESGNFAAVRYILQHPELGDLINQKDNMGNTPLHLATLHWHPKIVHALTWDKRVNLTLLNHENETALDIAVRTRDQNPPLEQRLTWSALKSAGTPRSFVRHRSRGTKDVVKKEETDMKHYKGRINIAGTPQSFVSHRSRGTEVVAEKEEPDMKQVEQEETDMKHYVVKKGEPDMKHYKGRIDTLILVSTLIITASFAAGFAMPGSIDRGRAVMRHHVMFHLFILFLTISIFGAIITTIILLWAQLEDLCLMEFSLVCARPVLGISLMTLSLAFLAGVYLVVSELSWLAYTFLVISVVLILVVVILYSLLWLPSPSTSRFSRYISYYPFLFLAMMAEGKKDANNKGSTSGSPDFY
ncbi:protein ACCELERATED CELL DEATH 6-like [Prosopis cineraria]|uniref:protein ACCELERATED CELL DEATH 6-like n=1 Tax=Prosopis cineraria TaxID=364024 RepID=UPI002410A4A9|nr:protein ACCELERATED CELL DEATH 6-like [Prosopis cineraria]